MNSQITVQGSVIGAGVSETFGTPQTGLIAMANATAPGGAGVTQALVMGDNTLAIPTGAKMVVIAWTSGISKTVKGTGGDTGIPTGTIQPAFLVLPVSGSSIVINSAAADTVTVWWL